MSSGLGPQGAPGGRPGDDPSVVVHGDNRGIVSTGAYAFNVVYAEGRFVEARSVLELPLREPPALPVSSRPRLFGRDATVAEIAERLTTGGRAQLYGPPGVGKKAIAWAVHRRLAVSGVRGHALLPRAGEEDTLEALYGRLAGLFFGRNFLRGVDESMLRAAVAGVTAHLTLIDSTLSQEELSRLLETFSGCTFLITSQYRTLPDPGAAHHVQPLARAAAVDLLSAELGLPLGPAGLQNLQFDHVYRMAEGRPQRLLQYAEFIKASDEWRARLTEEPFDRPRPVDPGLLSPQRQAETLAVALGETARQVLLALATFGPAMDSAWFAAVTGNPRAMDSAAELCDRQLVMCDAGICRITEDAVAAVRAQNWGRSDVLTAARGILAWLTGPYAPPAPDPQLLLAVAHELDAAHQWATAAQFARIAAPVALQTGRGQTALQLYALGRKAAGLGGSAADVEYYLRTGEQTRRLLEGDEVAAVAALALFAAGVGQTASFGAAGGVAGKGGGLVGKAAGSLKGLPLYTKAGLAGAAIAVAATGTVIAVNSGGDEGPSARCPNPPAGYANACTLKPGDCFERPSFAGEMESIKLAQCGQAHGGQAIGAFTEPSGPWPGQDGYRRDAGTKCRPILNKNVDKSELDQTAQLGYLGPNSVTWDTGYHHVICIVFSDSATWTTSALTPDADLSVPTRN